MVCDSLSMIDVKPIHKKLIYYLNEEYKNKMMSKTNIFTTENMEIVSLIVPQQHNTYDCGVYVLHYVENFFMV